MIDTKVLPGGGLRIGDRQLEDTSLGTMAHVNPTTGQVQAEFSIAGPTEIDAAVAAARGAAREWRSWRPDDRQDVLFRLAALIEASAEELGEIGVLENGTPISFASFAGGLVPAQWFRYYAGWIDKLTGSVVPTEPGHLDYATLQPYGVVAIFTAFNAPAAFLGMKAGPALAAGNTVVVKPSELAPWSSLRFAELCLDAGIPPGVVNIVPGDKRAGEALASHTGIDKLSFTGSAATARSVMAAAANGLTPVTLELGGKSASIIFDDADLDAAIATSLQGGLIICSGQACAAGTRLLVQRGVYDEVVETAIALADTDNVGDPSDSGTLMGPVISDHHCNRILGVIDEARSGGAGDLVAGGNRMGGELADGYFIEPTVFAGVDPQSSLARNEVFGPVLSIIPFDTEAEAVQIANDSDYGLAGYIFTTDLGRAHRVSDELETGYISVNTFNPIPAASPFGGAKDSGFGREGGLDGIREMTWTKNIHVKF